MRDCLMLAATLYLGLALSCSGGDSSSRPTPPSGNLILRLGSDSLPGYSQAVVSLEKVEGTTDGSNWIALGSVKATFDLVALQNGRSVVILPASAVAPATYSQFRITWATVNYQSAINQPAYVVPTGGSGQILTMPTTTVVPGLLTVPANGSATALIMLNGQQAVQSMPNGVYAFQATAKAIDLAGSATLSGRAGDGATPLSGVEVFAETVDGSGLATLQRRAFTDATGGFTLEGLPVGSLYFLVCQPAGTVTSYAAVASAPINATGASTYTANLAFNTTQTPGNLTVILTPPSLATQGTWGELRQTLATGTTGTQTLIVRSQPMTTGLYQDSTAFFGLAPGTYGVTVQRSTSGATPVMKTGTQLLVSAGGTATTTLTFP